MGRLLRKHGIMSDYVYQMLIVNILILLSVMMNLSETEPQAIVDNRVTKTFAMAIARQESAWNPMAQSSANARGLMQLLPSTAQKTAENQQLPYNGESDLFKPLNNILLGTAHLNELNAKYPNNRI